MRGSTDTHGEERRTVYLDHAATSWPKPQVVVDAIHLALTEYGGNPGRGAYRLAIDTARAIHSLRTDIARYLGISDAHDLLFQPGCTQAMNLVLHGLIEPGDRVVAAPMEHNAVARPLNALAVAGADVVLLDTDEAGYLDPDDVERVVSAAPTKAVVCQHAGNVTGAIQPIADLTDIAHEHGALMLVDGAQAGGHLQVDLGALGVDAWACSGHKGLLGPQGVGLLYLHPDCRPKELVSGGTGSGASEDALQPQARPDRYEAGTLNTPGILGLGAAVRFLQARGTEQRAAEAALTRRFMEGAERIGFRTLGPAAYEERAPIVSVVHESVEADRLAFALDRRFGIAARAGLHCAPWAHRTLGTIETGALRFGIGYGNTEQDIDYAINALAELVGDLG